MAYVLKNQEGTIVAASSAVVMTAPWEFMESNHPDYIAFLQQELHQQDAFRESDIQLARVLEDLINVLINRNLIQFTDFPLAAQKRLNDRKFMRMTNKLTGLLGDAYENGQHETIALTPMNLNKSESKETALSEPH